MKNWDLKRLQSFMIYPEHGFQLYGFVSNDQEDDFDELEFKRHTTCGMHLDGVDTFKLNSN